MLIKSYKLQQNLNFLFCTINSEKFIIIKNNENKFKIYIKIPNFINISKNKDILYFKLINSLISKNIFKGFCFFFFNIIANLRFPFSKTLIFRGLGLKVSFLNFFLIFKLGYSHDVIVEYKDISQNLIIKKNSLTFFSYNKIKLGILLYRIYLLKKANCYKNRGFYFKNFPIILKTIKKT